MAVDQSYLPDIRRLALAGKVTFKVHCSQRMIERGIERDDILHILKSGTNEIVEIQVPTLRSPNERVLVYDPAYGKKIIVVLTPLLQIAPDLRIITVEFVDNSIWKSSSNAPPSIQRI